ncbi:MAG: sel1 repeat family protein [Neisseriaceae bacterium]|nr:sel1 repeat family protein [Neisseriaceae bacterium]
MKLKSVLLTAVFTLTPLAQAENAENLFYQGVHAHKQGDYTQAAKLWEKDCNAGSERSCYNLGLLYYNGHGVKKDAAQAAKIWEKSCHNNEKRSCGNLGWLYEKGFGVKQNLFTAKRYYEKSCYLGEPKICDRYKELN